MYTEILRSMTGIHVFPVISLLLFTGVFAAVLVWAICADRRALDRHAALPLDESAAIGADLPHSAVERGRV
jgi:hypothetical protein